MALKLPEWNNSARRFIGVCADLVSADDKLLEWVRDLPYMAAETELSGHKTVLRLILGGVSKTHTHIDISAAGFFRDVGPTDTPMADIESAFSILVGKEIKGEARGAYLVPIAQLPMMISSHIVQAAAGDLNVKMVGGKLKVEGKNLPISEIEWSLRSGNMAKIEFVNTFQAKITEELLSEAARDMESAFTAFVLEGEPRGTADTE